jgi:hypothetical protein
MRHWGRTFVVGGAMLAFLLRRSPLTAFHLYLFLSRSPTCPCPLAAATQARRHRPLRVARQPGERAVTGRAQARRRPSWPLLGRATISSGASWPELAIPLLRCVVWKKNEKRMLQAYVSSVSDIL